MATIVVLDTNALLMPFQFGVNLDSELKRLLGSCEIIVPSSVLEELKRIRERRLAKAAGDLALKFKVVRTREKGDEAILQVARKLRAAVVTNDRELIKALKKLKIPVIYLRSRTHLELSGSFL
ncbi:MAG: twitching motility protein PilT [Thermoplasmata archaeon]|nr:twitching motility protein PilT [Thermoplasmata archaeon]